MASKPDRPEVSVVIPTYNERENILELLDRLAVILRGVRMEVVVVDARSPDGTGRLVADTARRRPWLRVIHGAPSSLSGSVLEGLRQAKGQVLCVMDADLSHDPALLPKMADLVRQGHELVIASRWMPGGGVEEWPAWRRTLSRMGAWMARRLLALPITDPLSGYFAMDHRFCAQAAPRVHPRGFKILLEFSVRGEPRRVAEVPLRFRNRQRGRSKLTVAVGWQFLLALADLAMERRGGALRR